MRQLLLFICLVHIGLLNAQTFNGLVTPITDYNQCYTGFVNGQKDTIWPIQFQKVHKADVPYFANNYRYIDELGWIVMYDDLYGVIDRFGVNIIPFKYTSIKPLRNAGDSYFIVESAGQYGVIDRDGKQVLPPEYQEIFSNNYGQCGFYQEGKQGRFDRSFNIIIPAIYDHITFRWEEYYVHSDSTFDQRYIQFYEVELGDKKGLLDTLGKEIVPPIYNEIDPVFPENDCSFELTYFLGMKDMKYGLYEQGRGEIIAPQYDDLYLHYRADNCSKPYIPVVHTVTRDNRKKRNEFHVIELRSERTSLPYDGVYYYEDGMFFTERKGMYSVIDSTLLPIIQDFPYRFTVYAASIDGHYKRLRKKDDLLIITEHTKPKEPYHIYPDHSREDKKGLYQISTGRYTEVIYDRIELHHKDDKIYYWAFIYKQIGTNLLAIYDQELNLIKEMDVKEMDEFNQPSVEGFLRKDPAYIIQNKKEKWGILDASGEELIPFEFVSYDKLGDRYCDTNRFMLQLDDGKKGVFDECGNTLAPAIYDSVACNCDGLALGYKDDKYDGYLFGRAVITKAEKLSFTRVQDYNHSHFYDRIGENTFATSFFTVRDDTLYIYENGELVKMDHKRSRFDWRVQVYDNRYLVNRLGRVIIDGEYTLLSLNEVALVYNIHETKLIDENGKILLELDGYYYITKSGEYYYARHNNKKGILDPKTFQWVIEPKYDDIDLIRNIPGNYFLVRTSRGEFGSFWQILDDKGELAIPFAFDHAVHFKKNEFAEFASQGKKGILSPSMEILIEPKYDAIFRVNDTYWINSGGKWGAWREGYETLEPQFPNVSAIHNGNRFIAINTDGDLVFVNSDLTVSQPKSHNSLLHSDELRNYFGKNQNSLSNVGNYPYRYRNPADALDTLINNYSTLLLIRQNTFSHLNNYVHHDILNYTRANNRIQHTDYRISHSFIHLPNRKGRYYSFFEVNAKGMIDSRYDYDLKTIQTSEIEQKLIRNIDLTDADLRNLSLSDLFKSESQWEATLDSAITNVINERQLFGVSCVDLNGILMEFKAHFYIGPRGFEFYRNRYLEGHKVIIPYKELKAVLKHPEDFEL